MCSFLLPAPAEQTQSGEAGGEEWEGGGERRIRHRYCCIEWTSTQAGSGLKVYKYSSHAGISIRFTRTVVHRETKVRSTCVPGCSRPAASAK